MKSLKSDTNKSTLHNTPETIGIIMDGNRRFARARNLPIALGHRAGFEKLKDVVVWASERGVKRIVAYALSTENWKRDKEEIDNLLNLFRYALSKTESILRRGVKKISFMGNLRMFPDDIYNSMKKVEEKKGVGDGLELVLAVSYGGRSEIVEAVKKLSLRDRKNLSEDILSRNLYTKNFSDPDLILRTGGEMRLSNFLLWQSAYAELFFSKTLWPAFTKSEFVAILDEYGRRKRNFGR